MGSMEEAVALFHQVLHDLFPPDNNNEQNNQPT